MATVVGVHGIAQEQLGEDTLINAWAPALRNGLRIAARPAAPPPIDFDLAYYGDRFLSEADQGLPVMKGPNHVAGNDLPGELSSAEVEFLQAVAADIPVDETKAPKGSPKVPDVLLPMTQRLCRRFDGWVVVAFVPLLLQVRLYLEDDDLAEDLRARVIEKIGAGCNVLIGHSLGSVVAFETLALNPDLQVGTLMTIGSPLSMKTVATRLRAGRPAELGADGGAWMPGAVARWVNIYDKSDPVAGAGVACRLWSAAEDFEVNNGNEPHSIIHYLSKRIAGEVVVTATRSPE